MRIKGLEVSKRVQRLSRDSDEESSSESECDGRAVQRQGKEHAVADGDMGNDLYFVNEESKAAVLTELPDNYD